MQQRERAAKLGGRRRGPSHLDAAGQLAGPAFTGVPAVVVRDGETTEQNDLVPIDMPVGAHLSLLGKRLPGKEVEPMVVAVPTEILVWLEREIVPVIARAVVDLGVGYRPP